MADTTTPQIFLQYPIFTRFILPFLLIFFIVFAILEKTNVLGKDKRQLNALISFVIGLIFVTVLSPTLIVSNLILFLTISLVIVFVVLLIWGFVSGEEGFNLKEHKFLRTVLLIVVLIAVIFAVIWAITGTNFSGIINFLFGQGWSNSFWTNFIFVVLIAVAIALVWRSTVAAKK